MLSSNGAREKDSGNNKDISNGEEVRKSTGIENEGKNTALTS